MGGPTHKHGMAKPRRSLGLTTLAATTTGPIRAVLSLGTHRRLTTPPDTGSPLGGLPWARMGT
jgi:hypothetical protein